MFEKFTDCVRNVSALRGEGRTAEARQVLDATLADIFGEGVAKQLSGMSPAAAVAKLGTRERVGVYAALIALRSEDQDKAPVVRALELQLASLAAFDVGKEKTKTAIRALRSKVEIDMLAPALRRALEAVG